MGSPEGVTGGLLQELHSKVAHPLSPVLLGAALAALPRAPQSLVIHCQLLYPIAHCTQQGSELLCPVADCTGMVNDRASCSPLLTAHSKGQRSCALLLIAQAWSMTEQAAVDSFVGERQHAALCCQLDSQDGQHGHSRLHTSADCTSILYRA